MTTVTDRAPSRAEAVFGRDTTDARALVLDGYGASLTVQRGHLVLADGIGATRRTRKLSRVDRTVRRIIVLAHDGYVTLEALRWCADVGITVVTVNRDGTVIGHAGAASPDDARLRRAQAVAGAPVHPAGLHLVRMILTAKLDGQADIAENVFLNRAAAASIRATRDGLTKAGSIDACRSMEGGAASLYWQSWFGSACPYWDPAELLTLPAHWCMFTGRSAVTRDDRRNRNATDPVNASLNYCYRLAESECRAQLLALGLDPAFGVLHADRPGRDSLALDLLEALRPEIDRTVIDCLGCDHRRNHSGYLSRRLFVETRTGDVRLCAPLTHEFAEHLPRWGAVIAPYARKMMDLFSSVASGATPDDYAAVVTGKVGKAGRPSIGDDDIVRIPGCVADIVSAVTDDLWLQVADVLAEMASRTAKQGRAGKPRKDGRDCLIALLVRMNGHPVPAHMGVARSTAMNRFVEWKRSGAWAEMRHIIMEHQANTLNSFD